MSAARRSALRGLYAITPPRRDSARLEAEVRACLEGGARILQYRFKDLPPSVAREQAERLAGACREHRATFIVNDSLELARAVGADGVHLGRDDGDAHAARSAWPEGIIGVSCYRDTGLAREAALAGADYVGIGSIFASPTKPGSPRAPIATLREAHAASGLPVAAIGGITLANAREAIDAGAHMLAVISAIFDAPDIRAAARDFQTLFEARSAGAMHVRP